MSNPNPVNKCKVPQKYNLYDKDMQLAKDIMKFNLMLFNKYDGKADSPEELQQRFEEYFTLCMEYGRIPTVERSCYDFWLF